MNAKTANEIDERLLVLLQQHTNLQDGSFPLDANLEDLGLDSLRAVDLLIALEDNFGVFFPESLLTEETFRTASTLRAAIKQLVQS